MPSDLAVTVPAQAEFVPVLRAVVAGIAARLDFPYDAIEDLRIAVDEACGQLLGSRAGTATTLRLRVTPLPGGIELVASTDAPVDTWPPEGAERGLAWQVIEGLTDRAAFELDGEGPALRMAKLVDHPEARE